MCKFIMHTNSIVSRSAGEWGRTCHLIFGCYVVSCSFGDAWLLAVAITDL